jgi:hypothetical protein
VGGADQVDAGHRRADQPDQAEPEAVAVGDGVALDQAAGGERRREPRRGGLVDPEPAAEVGHPQLALLGDQFERAHRPGDRPDPTLALVAHSATVTLSTHQEEDGSALPMGRRPIGGLAWGRSPCTHC